MASTMRFDKWENPTGTRSLDITSATPGLTPILPTSLVVPSGTASTNALGTITFTGVQKIQILGVFSSAYTNYLIVHHGNGSSNSVGIRAKLMLGSTETSDTTYNNVGTWMTSGNAPQALLSSNYTTELFAGSGGSGYSGKIEVFGPNIYASTNFITALKGLNSIPAHEFSMNSCRHDQVASYTGISIYGSTGTFTGTMTIYGYNA